MQAHPETTDSSTASAPLQDALQRLFAPLARLCLANGMLYADAEELLRHCFVDEARALQPDQAERGMVSRIAAATGINRRETTRLLRQAPARRSVKVPLASQIIARWAADPQYRAADGSPLPLPRQGEAPSFESLARSITQDLHPRTVLDELLRLGLIRHDEADDRICLLQQDYIPGNDQAEMLAFLGDNVGDHLESAVANLLKDDIQHHDQAIFADELSEQSLKALAPLILQHWYALRDELVPVITGLLEADSQADRPRDQRLRVGLYSYSEPQ